MFAGWHGAATSCQNNNSCWLGVNRIHSRRLIWIENRNDRQNHKPSSQTNQQQPSEVADCDKILCEYCGSSMSLNQRLRITNQSSLSFSWQKFRLGKKTDQSEAIIESTISNICIVLYGPLIELVTNR
jgi:hypothetical protein